MYTLEQLEEMQNWDLDSLSDNELNKIAEVLWIKTKGNDYIACLDIRDFKTTSSLIKKLNDVLQSRNITDCEISHDEGSSFELRQSFVKEKPQIINEVKIQIKREILRLRHQESERLKRLEEDRNLYEKLKKRFEK